VDFFNASTAKEPRRQWEEMYRRSDIMTKQKLRLAFGGTLENFTEQNVKRMVEMGATELILTSPDLEPHPDFVFLAKKYDCKAGYDMEAAIWAFNAFGYLDLSQPYYQEKFMGIKNADYDFAMSEGLFRDMPAQIRKVLPYYNFGGEHGENMYLSGYYAHPPDSHDANYPETYHVEDVETYFNTYTDYYSKCKNFGLTFQVYPTSSLELDPNAMLQFMDRLEGAGVHIGTVLFWAGLNDFWLLSKVDSGGLMNPLYSALQTTYGFVRDIDIQQPVPKPPLDELLGSVKETIEPAYIVWHMMGVWDSKGNARLAREQARIELVEELWAQSQNKAKADKLEIRERGDVYYFGNGIWYTEGNGWHKY